MDPVSKSKNFQVYFSRYSSFHAFSRPQICFVEFKHFQHFQAPVFINPIQHSEKYLQMQQDDIILNPLDLVEVVDPTHASK